MEIEQHDVGLLRGHGLDALEAVGGLARHVEPGNARQERGDAAPEQRVIVDDDDADRPGDPSRARASRRLARCAAGSRRGARRQRRWSTTSVPAPGRDRTLSAPPILPARSRMIRKPTWSPHLAQAPGSKPHPLSRTVNA